VVDGDLPDLKLPIIPGHEIVGIVDAVGDQVRFLGSATESVFMA
jgi:propanol-preferring alcohol dehydrogenase